MNHTERALTFDCNGDRLLGVASLPDEPGAIGMLVIVGGPQYRAGSHRQFVQLARSAAGAGVPVLRFDCRGMGDSEGSLRDFEQISDDIRAAIDTLMGAAPSVRRVALWGLCDGASAALLYLDQQRPDPRVAGLCLLNPWVRSAATLARTQVKHYYTQRLRQPAFWAKLLRGRVAWQALHELAGNVVALGKRTPADPASTSTTLPFTARMARQWHHFSGHLLLLLSGSDYTAKEFAEAWASDPAWRGAASRRGLQLVDLPEADHTLSDAHSQRTMEQCCLQWLNALTRESVARSSPLSRTLAHNHAG